MNSAATKIFIAGGGGFLGAASAKTLLDLGCSIATLGLGAPPPSIGLAHYDGLISRGLLESVMASQGVPDVIVHAAGGSSVGRSWADPTGDFELSVASTVEILDFLRTQAPHARLVLVSSAAVYGEAGEPPFIELGPFAPVSPYGVHKKICEDLVEAERRMRGLGAIVIRFFSLYGEGLRKQLLWDLLERGRAANGGVVELWGDGDETRDFLHVEDAARVIAAAVLRARTGEFEVFNAASGEAVTVRRLAERLRQAAGYAFELNFNGKVRKGDPRHLIGVVDRMRSVLKVEPVVSLDAGLRRVADWHGKIS